MRLHNGRAVGLEERDADVGRRRIRIGEQDEFVEVGTSRAFGQEPLQRRRRDTGALVAGGEELPAAREVQRAFDGDRLRIREQTVTTALQMLLQLLDPAEREQNKQGAR